MNIPRGNISVAGASQGTVSLTETRHPSNDVGIHAHAGSTLHNPVTLTFDLLTSGLMRAEVMPSNICEYMGVWC